MGRTIGFQQLEAFCAVILYGTTTRAAQALNTTQPSISRRLQELQQRSGLLLFEMDKGRLKATAEGMKLYYSIQKHFDGLSKIDHIISKMKKSGIGMLNIGCTPTLGCGLLPDIIGEFKISHPDVWLSVQTNGSRHLLSLLNQQLIDVMLTCRLIDDQHVDCEILRLIHAVCVLPLNHPLAEAPSINADMLVDHNILSLNSDDYISCKVAQHFALNDLLHHPVIETSSSMTLCSMVCAQLGVAIVNPFVAKIFSGKLLIKPFYPAITTPVQVVIAQGRGLPWLAREFINVLKSNIPSSGSGRGGCQPAIQVT